jgi:hypothetical protein
MLATIWPRRFQACGLSPPAHAAALNFAPARVRRPAVFRVASNRRTASLCLGGVPDHVSHRGGNREHGGALPDRGKLEARAGGSHGLSPSRSWRTPARFRVHLTMRSLVGIVLTESSRILGSSGFCPGPLCSRNAPSPVVSCLARRSMFRYLTSHSVVFTLYLANEAIRNADFGGGPIFVWPPEPNREQGAGRFI